MSQDAVFIRRLFYVNIKIKQVTEAWTTKKGTLKLRAPYEFSDSTVSRQSTGLAGLADSEVGETGAGSSVAPASGFGSSALG